LVGLDCLNLGQAIEWFEGLEEEYGEWNKITSLRFQFFKPSS